MGLKTGHCNDLPETQGQPSPSEGQSPQRQPLCAVVSVDLTVHYDVIPQTYV
jgi:hypothetical protein